jgi:S1-C subfamily serine protease
LKDETSWRAPLASSQLTSIHSHVHVKLVSRSLGVEDVLRISALSFAISFFLTLFIASPNAIAQSQQATEDVAKKCSDAVVLIFVSDFGKDVGLGSGFIVSADGKIITNYHVIKNAQNALVKLTNGAFFPVESVISVDATQDLAVIKVAGKNLPTLSMANSDTVKVGERVVAIGNPLGFETTVTDGIVSAVRNESTASWIQTTAPVSPGNSGGPLLRMDGTVLGVITWNVKSAQNLNFAATSAEVTALMAKPNNTKPLNAQITPTTTSAGAADPHGNSSDATTDVALIGGIWSSTSSGKDYSVRQDGDYLYAEWSNVPAAWGDSAFAKTELKKTGAIWAGHGRARFPCQYGLRTNWITADFEMEITSITRSRIEGRVKNYSSFNCRTGKPKGKAEWVSLVWIPK